MSIKLFGWMGLGEYLLTILVGGLTGGATALLIWWGLGLT